MQASTAAVPMRSVTDVRRTKRFVCTADTFAAVVWIFWAGVSILLATGWAFFSKSRIVLIEMLLVIASVIAGMYAPGFAARLLRRFDDLLRRIAKKRAASVLLVATIALAGRTALLPRFPVPSARMHDEFSYLLAGDTFASGRMTNPTHPLWHHFETFHVDQIPTYMSMYPPAQGLVLALGTVVFGNPWTGVLLSAAGMCAAICWALQGWVPSRWALMGGLLVALRVGVLSYFANSYWGGAVPAIGGALVVGALPRIAKHCRPLDTLPMVLGLIILANSRPYEGFLFAVPVIIMLVGWVLRDRVLRTRLLATRTLIPAATLGCVAAVAMSYYNARVFGNPFVPPYHANRAMYAVAPVFPWEKVATAPHYTHKVMQDFYLGFELAEYKNAWTVAGRIEQTIWKAISFWDLFVGPALSIPFIVIAAVIRDRRYRVLWVSSAVLFAFILVGIFFNPHYAAPAMAAFVILLVQAIRRLAAWKRQNRRAGLFISRMILPVSLLVLVIVSCFPAQLAKPWPDYRWYYFVKNATPRDRAVQFFQTQPGRHLAIVRYAPTHHPFQEWVFNAADIDHSRIVWARDMGDAGNADLMAYFTDRRVWLVEPDIQEGRISAYGPQ